MGVSILCSLRIYQVAFNTLATRMLVTSPIAKRIPQELFSNIIYFLCSEKYHSDDGDSSRKLGKFSLVSRYWASKIRPYIFETITLRSRDDALTFIMFAKYPKWTAYSIFPIGKYLSELRLEVVDVHTLPWIHLILHCMPNHLLGPASDSRILLSLRFLGAKHEDTVRPAPRSVYDGLPRRFPRSFISRFEMRSHVVIEEITFSQSKDLLSFINSISPHMRGIRCHAIQWQTEPLLDIILGSTIERMIQSPIGFRTILSPPALTFIKMLIVRRVAKGSFPPQNPAQTYQDMVSELQVLSVLQRRIFRKGQISDESSEEDVQKESTVVLSSKPPPF